MDPTLLASFFSSGGGGGIGGLASKLLGGDSTKVTQNSSNSSNVTVANVLGGTSGSPSGASSAPTTSSDIAPSSSAYPLNYLASNPGFLSNPAIQTANMYSQNAASAAALGLTTTTPALTDSAKTALLALVGLFVVVFVFGHKKGRQA